MTPKTIRFDESESGESRKTAWTVSEATAAYCEAYKDLQEVYDKVFRNIAALYGDEAADDKGEQFSQSFNDLCGQLLCLIGDAITENLATHSHTV